MRAPLVADTGGLLRALARRPDGQASWPDFEEALLTATTVVVPALVLAEVDHFLRNERTAMRRWVAEIFDPSTTYELEPLYPQDVVRALEIDAKFQQLGIGLVDGLVAAIAERRKMPRILTTDRRHFHALRIGEGYRRTLIVVP